MKNYLIALTLVSTFAIVHTMEFQEDIVEKPKSAGNIEINRLIDCFKEVNQKPFELGARKRCYLKAKKGKNV